MPPVHVLRHTPGYPPATDVHVGVAGRENVLPACQAASRVTRGHGRLVVRIDNAWP
jgi:hypothetical protein